MKTKQFKPAYIKPEIGEDSYPLGTSVCATSANDATLSDVLSEDFGEI